MTDLYIVVSGKVCARATDKGGSPKIIYDMDSEGVNAGYSISLSMPIRRNGYGGGVVKNWLDNLLPENIGDRERIARDQSGGLGVCNINNPLKMLEKIGEDCAGAVQVVREGRLDAVLNNGGIDPISEAEVETMIRDVRTGRAIAGRSPERLQGRFSLAGAQKKTALRLLDDGSWGIPFGNEPTTHILKPPMANMHGQLEGEHFCLQLARSVSLWAAESEVLTFGDEKVICVRRFDRRNDPSNDGRMMRLHIEDMCQALGQPPSNKYQSDGGPGVTEICGRVLSYSRTSQIDRIAFMNAMLLNWILMGTDAHAKNYSIYLLPPVPSNPNYPSTLLAPLYDINTYAIAPESSWTSNRMSMSVDSKFVFSHIHERHWHSACEKAGVYHKDRRQWLEETVCRIRSAAHIVAERIIEEGLDPDLMSNIARTTADRCESVLSDMFPDKFLF